MKIGQKKGFKRNARVPKPMKVFNSRIETTILKPVTTLC